MKNKMKSHAIVAAIALFFITGCKDKGITPPIPENQDNKPIAVVITANTALRIDPLITSSRVEQLKKGEIIEILDRSYEQKVIAEQKSYWYKAKLSNGITGWIFGSHINIIKDGNRGNVESYLSKFWEKETDELSQALHGKWWSINRFGDYTNNCLEIYKDGKYKSYIKGATQKIEGNYNFDFNESKIIFLGGTSFEGDLNYARRGDFLVLYRETSIDEIRFKKISTNPESETEDQVLEKKEENSDAIKKEDEN